MADSVFEVGDTVQLVGSGWDNYCSTPLAGKLCTVKEVDDKGQAEIIAVEDSEYGYYAWVSPDENHRLFGVVIK